MGVVRARQSTSLRIDQILYDRLAELAASRRTSITRQLEKAIQLYLETAVVEKDLDIVQPALRKVINDNLESALMEKIDQVKERLASLLARVAVDSAAVYLIQTQKYSEDQIARLRGVAAKHVRGKVADFQADDVLAEELESLRSQVMALQSALRTKEGELATSKSNHEASMKQLKAEVDGLHRMLVWQKGLLNWLKDEWDKQGMLTRRKPFTAVQDEYHQKHPQPLVSSHASLRQG